MNIPFSIDDEVSVVKQNHLGEEKWRYKGRVVSINENEIQIEAFFDIQKMEIAGILVNYGDRFLETYYTNRWYNIYEIYAREDGSFLGCYCNISTPVEVSKNAVCYKDLALDLVVFPDGGQTVLDKKEFESLQITSQIREKAISALKELQENFKNQAK